ncbi:MAG: hypothetical protein V7603_3282 [Micromonosporaceae bacterium]
MRAAAHDAVTKGRAMARERYSPRSSNYDAPGGYEEPSIYDSPAGERMRSAPPVRKSRRLVKPFGVLAAVAAIAAGGAIYVATSHAATDNMDCTLVVPANPLTAAGLATPYQLVATNAANGACNEANANQSAFVQGAIIGADGQISLYNPLVIDQGTQAAAAPAAATVPAGATIGLWFGFNGANLTLRSANGTNALRQGQCVNGSRGSIFGQFAYCNAPAFFQAANAAVQAGTLKVPALGTAKDGKACPTVRDFSLVDMDQSDNVVTHYLANAKGQTAQPNAAGKAAVGAAGVDLANGSDNRLLDVFVDPTLGCTPWTLPEQSADGTPASALPLNELQAAAGQAAPIAIVPLTDPMTLNGANTSNQKTNLYRAGVDQPALGAADNGSGATYCQNLFTNAAGLQRVFNAQATFALGRSPDAGAATNLFTFLAMRGNDAFTGLNCQNFNVANPITLTTDANGVVTAAAFGAGGAGGGTGTSAAPSTSSSAAAGTSTAPSALPSTSTSAAAGTSTAPSTAPTVTPPSTRTCWWWWQRRGHRCGHR